MGTLSTNFNWTELIKEDLNTVPSEVKTNIKNLTNTILQPARELLGLPIHISSGYRSPKHNASVGGAKNSQHLYGTAADIWVDSLTSLQLFDFFVKNFGDKLGGIGLYADENTKGNFIHVDIRARVNNSVTAWYQTSAGVYISPGPIMQNIFRKYNKNFIG